MTAQLCDEGRDIPNDDHFLVGDLRRGVNLGDILDCQFILDRIAERLG
jgi:hypothetical protein